MRKLAFIGAGSHSDAVFYMQNMDEFEFKGYFDDKKETMYNGYSILGDIESVIEALDNNTIDNVFITIGDNVKRKEVFEMISVKHYDKLINIIASTSTVLNNDSLLGKNIFIGHGVFIGADVKIHDNVIVNTSSTIEHHTVINRHCNITINCCVAGIVNLKEGVYLGCNSTVIQCMNIEAWVKTGAGTIVVKDLDIDKSLYVGAPARYVRKDEQE